MNSNEVCSFIKSRSWAREFLLQSGRFPNAIEYENAGYGEGQCGCVMGGQCALSDHELFPVSCDRNCYADQLRDFIAITRQLPNVDESLHRDAKSWRWLKSVVEKTGYIDFGGDALPQAIIQSDDGVANAAIREAADRIEQLEAKLKQAHKDYGCEIRDPCGTIWQQAARTQEANEKMKSLLQKIAYPRRGTGEEMMSIDDAAKSIQSVFSLEDLEPSA